MRAIPNQSLVTYSYARTSGVINGELSIPNQLELMQRYAETNGLIIKGELIDKEQTGTNLNRSSFQKLKSLAEAEKVDVILVPYFDRFSRTSEFLSDFLMLLKSKDIECISVSNGRRLSQMSSMEIAIISLMAEEENKSRTKRISASKEKSVRSGQFIYTPPYGYRRNQQRYLVIEEKEAKIVNLIFQLFIDGLSPNQIAKELNANQKQVDRHWQATTVTQVLINKTYTGNQYRKEENEDGSISYTQLSSVLHPPIIELAVFNSSYKRLENMLQSRKEKSGKRKKHFHIFKDILLCPDCNKAMKGDSLYYFCNNQYCKKKRIRKDIIEPKLFKFIANLNAEQNSNLEEINKFERRKQTLVAELDRVQQQFAKNKFSLESYKSRTFELGEQIKEVNAVIDFEVYTQNPATYESLIQKKDYKELWNKLKQDGLHLTYNGHDNTIEIVEPK